MTLSQELSAPRTGTRASKLPGLESALCVRRHTRGRGSFKSPSFLPFPLGCFVGCCEASVRMADRQGPRVWEVVTALCCLHLVSEWRSGGDALSLLSLLPSSALYHSPNLHLHMPVGDDLSLVLTSDCF